MKLKPLPLAIASAISFAIVWLLCSAVVVSAPELAAGTFDGMMHAEMPLIHVTLTGFLIGLGAWAFTAGMTALLIGIIYNAMIAGKTSA